MYRKHYIKYKFFTIKTMKLYIIKKLKIIFRLALVCRYLMIYLLEF